MPWSGKTPTPFGKAEIGKRALSFTDTDPYLGLSPSAPAAQPESLLGCLPFSHTLSSAWRFCCPSIGPTTWISPWTKTPISRIVEKTCDDNSQDKNRSKAPHTATDGPSERWGNRAHFLCKAVPTVRRKDASQLPTARRKDGSQLPTVRRKDGSQLPTVRRKDGVIAALTATLPETRIPITPAVPTGHRKTRTHPKVGIIRRRPSVARLPEPEAPGLVAIDGLDVRFGPDALAGMTSLMSRISEKAQVFIGYDMRDNSQGKTRRKDPSQLPTARRKISTTAGARKASVGFADFGYRSFVAPEHLPTQTKLRSPP